MRPPHKSTKEEVDFYEKQLQKGEGSYQLDGPVFIARYNQRGYGFGSILSGLARNFIKVLGRSALLASVKKSLKNRVIEAGTDLTKNVIEDKQGLKKSLKEGAKKLVSDVITDVISSNQAGKGVSQKKRKRRRSREDEDIFTWKKKKTRKQADVFHT